MAGKTKIERLRGAKKRRQSARRFVKFLIAVSVIILILAAAVYGAWQIPEMRSEMKALMRGNRAGGYELSEDYRQVPMGQAFDFAGGRMVVNGVYGSKGLQSAFGGGLGNEPPAHFKPRRGLYAIVLVTFRGSTHAETGTIDPASVRLVDEDNEVFVNKSVGSPAQDLYIKTGAAAFGRLELMNTSTQRSVLVFDVPPDAEGPLLAFLREEEQTMRVIRGVKIQLKGLRSWAQ